MAERCHCGHEWVTAAKEEVGKGLEKQFQGLHFILVYELSGMAQIQNT